MKQATPLLPETQHPRSVARELLHCALCLLPSVLAVGIIALSRIDAAATEAVYSQTIFPVISTVIGFLPGLLPFSLIAVICYAGVALAVVLLILLIVGMIRGRDRTGLLLRYLKGILLIPSVVFFLFAITCAPNYNRLTFAEQSGLVIRDSTPQELAALCEELIDRTKAAREEITEEDGVFSVGDHFSETADTALTAFHGLGEEYSFLWRVPIAPKAMIGSEILSYAEVTGFYSCYTAEPNVNVHMPDLELPFTMCHELAHTSGFMREDEANFIGYLACSQSDDANFRYSGLICALNYSMNQLYSADSDTYWALRGTYSDGMNRDLSLQSAYWKGYAEKKSVAVYTAVNDAFLKANQQTDGRKSYGRMVDLLLAEYRSRHGLE
jgi:NADH:ubiquinone oxidoreductase subunit 6 (subunit J)